MPTRKGFRWRPRTQADDAESIDPICNMTVKVAASRYVSNYNGNAVHFCSPGCKDKFEQEPEPATHLNRPRRSRFVSGAVVLHGQHLGQNGHGKLGRGSRPYIQANGSPDTG